MARFLLFLALILLGSPVVAERWRGWQGMRVIHQEGFPTRMIAADLGSDGREDLIVVNGRQARLDLYRWLPAAERPKASELDPSRPNELPLAPEWQRGEVSLDEVPLDVVAHDLDGDRRLELLVLTSPGHKIVAYQQSAGMTPEAKGAWKKLRTWDLLPGSPSNVPSVLTVRSLPTGAELLISFDQGIQILPLKNESRSAWLSPRENRGRLDWRWGDLDGDGDRDLIEWSPLPRQSVRWYECGPDGKLLPPQVLHDQGIDGLQVLERRDGPADLLLLGGSQPGLVRRYQLAHGAQSELGRHDALPMPGGQKAVWCGLTIDGRPALVALDPTQPRLRVHPLTQGGWQAEQTYPIPSGMRSLAAPAGAPGTLLLWAKDAGDLHRSRWEQGRISYPQPWLTTEQEAERRILTLETVGTTVYWVQRIGADLKLYVWPKDRAEPEDRLFSGVGAKTEKVVWLGDDRLLVQAAFSSTTQLVERRDGKTTIKTPPHLAKVDLNEFSLIPLESKLRPARLIDGVLQWLGDDLHPVDQVMLGEGQRLTSYVPRPRGEAWALEQGGGFLHRLAPDSAGVLRIADSLRPPAGQALRDDALLGLLLIDQERIVRLSRGEPWELKLLETIDGRVGRPSGRRETTIHRLLVVDLDGDGNDELLLADDRKHELSLVERTETELKALATWQVYEDQKYPYGDGSDLGFEQEPRRVLVFNADGDDVRDFALLSHDRLIIYLGRNR